MAAAAIEPTAALPDQRTRGFARRWYRTPSFVAGALILATLVGLAVLAPLVTQHSPTDQNLHNVLKGPSSDHWRSSYPARCACRRWDLSTASRCMSGPVRRRTGLLASRM